MTDEQPTWGGEHGGLPDILRYFDSQHLPQLLREVVMPFEHLAMLMVITLPLGAERSACFRKLLEAKDCAVRAAL